MRMPLKKLKYSENSMFQGFILKERFRKKYSCYCLTFITLKFVWSLKDWNLMRIDIELGENAAQTKMTS